MMIGADYTTISVVLILSILLGFLIFRLSRRLLRKVFKDVFARKINLISIAMAVVLSPAVIVGGIAVIIYASIDTKSVEQSAPYTYEMI